MKTFGVGRYALCSCVAATMLAGCGRSQPPIAAPGAMPRASALAVRTDSTKYKVLYSFTGTPDGAFPLANLTDVGGTLYGTTEGGGQYPNCSGYDSHCGVVFSIAPSGTEKVLYSFRERPDGSVPNASLTEVGGTLYGTTSDGGSFYCYPGSAYLPCGTVFSITPSGMEKVLHRFSGSGNGTDGAYPVASLIDVKGTLYGTTQYGGAYSCDIGGSCGTVFSILPSGAAETVLHSFGSGTDGIDPVAGLTEAKGTLYGTTLFGGAHAHGTVFSLKP
jgi:uncharacterized repeat protein (TIGR03803 family)